MAIRLDARPSPGVATCSKAVAAATSIASRAVNYGGVHNKPHPSSTGVRERFVAFELEERRGERITPSELGKLCWSC